jgi:glycogen synthase
LALVLYSHFFAPSIGGIETIVLSLARGLAAMRKTDGLRKFEVTLITQTPAGSYDDGALPFRVVRQPNLFQLWGLIRSADVVHAAGPPLAPLFLSLLARKPFVVEHHGFQTICPNGQLLIEPAGKPCPGHFMAARHLECVRCNSGTGWVASVRLWLLTFLRRALCAHAYSNIMPTQWLSGLLNLPRARVIPHGLEFAHIVPRRDLPSGKPTIVFLGRLVTTKGVRLLLEAVQILRKQNRSFEILIIGDGPERAALEQFVQSSNLTQVRFAGRLDNDQLEAAMAQAYAVVVPSLAGEVFGLVLAENMARSLPIVASDLGAFAEVLGGAGVIFRTGDSEDLARALSRVLDDPSFTATLGLQARRRVLDFCDQSRMIDEHANVYFEACSARMD